MLRSWWLVVIVCTALTADAGPVVEKPMAAINGEPEPYTIRISCGSVVDVISHVPRETVWSADYGYLGGVAVNNTPDDSNIIVPPLPTRRTFPSRGGCYLFTGVPRRHYSIRAFLGVDPEALFDISVQGMQVTSLPRDWIDSDNHLFVETLLFVLDGSVSICFNASHGDPSVVSLEVLELDYQAYHHGPRIDESLFLKTIIRVSCGSGKIIFDPQDTAGDRIWLDALTFGGDYQKPISTNKNIQKSSAPPNFYPEIIYKSAIVGAALDFTVDVDPNANYSLWFHFAELDDSITSIGQRLFDVVVNDVVIFEDVDVLNLTGESFSALALDARVYVDSKSLRIRFRGKNGAQAIISALEVMQIVQEGLHSGSQPKHSSIATICIVIGLFPLIVLLMRG